MTSIQTCIERYAGSAPDRIALTAPGRTPLTWQALAALIGQASEDLRRLGAAPGERIALVAPNGPELAAAFLAVTSVAPCAPLNPVYRADEFAFYLEDLRARTLVVAGNMPAEAVGAARQLGLRIIELKADEAGAAGTFTLCGTPVQQPSPGRRPGPDDEALVLHTSGTTSRPKLVPLSHGNLVASARAIRSSLALTDDDCCLNVMPLFHVHGLVAALLASLEAGACVACCPGFVPSRFFDWMEELQPTWYTTVPTIHRAVLDEAARRGTTIERGRLRFIRSCSAALPPSLMAELEAAFGVPVIEAYGMTEAAHQIASNPLPPRARKPGSVGVAAGPEVAIMDADGVLLERGQTGEVVIRGADVTAGYEANPEANARAFTNGWFRTGDQGYLDEDGYLFLTGRLKELINRGGEKIAPREVDEALLAHPAVAQAVAFAVPHSKLGEAVAAAVVTTCEVDEIELRRHASERLAHFKVPERIFVVETLPKGPTGKLQRIGLAEKLGVTEADLNASPSPRISAPPQSPREKMLARCFAEALSAETTPGLHDHFFAVLGGDSLSAAQLIARVEEITGVALAPEQFYANPTVAGLAAALDACPENRHRFLVTIRATGNLTPLVCIPGARGNLSGFYHLARRLHPLRPVYALRLPRATGTYAHYRIEDLAEAYLEELLARLPQGNLALLGVCAGGPPALELAHRLSALGRHVELVALLDSYNLAALSSLPVGSRLKLLGGQLRQRAAYLYKNLRGAETGGKRAVLGPRLRAFFEVRRESFGKLLYRLWSRAGAPLPRWLQEPHYAYFDAGTRYQPAPFDGRGLLFRVEEPRAGSFDIEGMGWGELFSRGYTLKEVPGGHLTCLREPHVAAIAAHLEQALAESGRLAPAGGDKDRGVVAGG